MMSEPTDADLLRVAEEAARAAGALIVSASAAGSPAASEKSSHTDLVTETDRRCQEAIRAIIHREFPSHAFLGEEDVPSGVTAAAAAILARAAAPYLWCVDPIDGTTNFVCGLPLCCVSIACARAGRVHAAVVFEPSRGEAFTALRGRGAAVNGAPARVSRAPALRAAVVAFGGLGRVPAVAEPSLRGLAALSGKARALRGLGSAALHLAYVAAGRLEASWDMSLSVWDTAAGALLVEEAGGRVSDFAGAPHALTTRDTVASNGAVHEELLQLLRGAGAVPPGDGSA